MVAKLSLSPPYAGMEFLWNTTSTVGADSQCVNSPSDVELVKYLLSLSIGTWGRVWVPPACMNQPLKVDGQFDAVLGFWLQLYSRNYDVPNRGRMMVLQPARNGEMSPLHLMNILAFENARDRWEHAPSILRYSSALRPATLRPRRYGLP